MEEKTVLRSSEEIEREAQKFQVLTFADILRALREHPDWLEEARRLILTHDLVELPRRFEEFLKEFHELKEDFHELKGEVNELRGEVNELRGEVNELRGEVNELRGEVNELRGEVNELRGEVNELRGEVDELKGEVHELRERVDKIEKDVEVLKQDVEVLKQDVAMLKQDMEVLKQDMRYVKSELGRLKGSDLERRVRERFYAYFGHLLKKARMIEARELVSMLEEAEEQGRITEEQLSEVLRLDLVVEGRIKTTKKEVVLAVEISHSLYESDIERAVNRANILSYLLGKEVIPTVACVEAREEIQRLAEERGVFLVRISDY